MTNKEKLEKFGLYNSAFEHDACGVGFVCNIKGNQSNKIIQDGLKVLNRLSHRGATGADPKTGDGAGILIQMPDEFLFRVCSEAGFDLPKKNKFAGGLVFLPNEEKQREFCKNLFAKIVKEQGHSLLGWRSVPTDNSDIGQAARQTQPVMEQVFIGCNHNIADDLVFERSLYVIRKLIENSIRSLPAEKKTFCYITNLSSRTLTYKGLLMPEQLEGFFVDLKDKDIKSALCLVHSRYSTNTFPTWDLAQPFRYLAHNGEINTLRGNINWMRAREGLISSNIFTEDLKRILPVIVPGGSDSAALDNVFEFLYLAGRPIAHVMMMLIPAAWQHNNSMDQRLRDFYKYHACFMEPWDGPAAVAFTDGKSIGAVLDRNGLRPARYIITKQDSVVMASEAGVLDIRAEDILSSGRLEPGKMFFVDTNAGLIIEDQKIKELVFTERPYGEWLKQAVVEMDELSPVKIHRDTAHKDTFVLMKAFGYTREDLRMIIKPMAQTAQEPVGSMGNDTPLAVLSSQPQLLYSYFKQLFAQVTNPPIDPIREDLVMSLDTYLGPEQNILVESEASCHKLHVKYPILTNEELDKIKFIQRNGFKTRIISLLFRVSDRGGLLSALDNLCREAETAIRQGYTFIVLSDRGVDSEYAAIPALLAVGALHHYLVERALRTRISILVESAEPREVHHFALLLGYGADCINPYLAYDSLKYLISEKELEPNFDAALKNYIKSIEKGILKIISKMGISTLQSYRGAQIFEALGIGNAVIQRCFPGTVSRIGGVDFKIIAQEAILRHQQAYGEGFKDNFNLASGGLYQWRKDGEYHLWNPETISLLQDAARNNDPKKYREFAALINDQSKNPCFLRSLFNFRKAEAIPIEQVEPVSSIVQRFVTGAMSFGSISRCAHEALAVAMNRLKGKSNTGEGGEDPLRFKPLSNGDSKRSAIKQVASGRFGVTTNYLVNADELQIKIAQGAKPGEGGQLPGHKVSQIIARTRYTTPGVTLISPPPHHDIYSIEDLAQLIFDLKNVNPRARISVKLVSEIGVGTVAAGVAKGHADMVLVSGGDGGTGASPLSSIKHAGLPWELGLSETHQTLVLNNLRSRLRLQTDGQMRTGRDVAIAAILGAEEFGFSTAALIVLGCVMLRHCHLNNCSVGVATQDEELEKRFTGNPEYIVNYFTFVAEELRQIMSELGMRSVDELVGRTDLLEINKEIFPWKAGGLDLSRVIYKPQVDFLVEMHYLDTQRDGLEGVLDFRLISLAKPALENMQTVKQNFSIVNSNRSCGSMLSGQVCRIYGEQGLPEDTIHYKFKGIAGQSFGAFLVKGVTFELEGMANDYAGKGISGGKIIVYPDRQSLYKPEENIIIGNTAFYGAITGEAYIRGVAGERFCIRNSGLNAVVEGVGDHGCEYMTGGTVVILGKTGRNFSAGMSGGIAYIYARGQEFKNQCNREMVVLEKVDEHDSRIIKGFLGRHYQYTQSCLAKSILDNFNVAKRFFIKVIPLEYKRVLEQKKADRKMELVEVSDG